MTRRENSGFVAKERLKCVLRLSCSLPFHARIRNWDRLDQCLRVWVFRMSENILHSSCFHQFPIMHHAYPVTQKPYHGKIVCNEQKRKTMLLLQMPEQVHDLCLNGYV